MGRDKAEGEGDRFGSLDGMTNDELDDFLNSED